MSAASMPQASPLRPISHWRIGYWPMLIALMLKTQDLRQFDRKTAADDRDPRRAGDKSSDAGHGRPLR